MPVEIDIARVAHLARIALSDEELEAYGEQLVHILEHAERVQALPTEGVEPTSHPLPMVNAFRPDTVTGSLDRDDALAGAPDAENGYYRVPKILDES
ncbi:MAG: Asp-tRNA(Asn)/Glu-tRNA(Gln) amidotransferase subunit GatC [Actinomycetota bacterium]